MLVVDIEDGNYTVHEVQESEGSVRAVNILLGITTDGQVVHIAKYQPSKEDLDAMREGRGLYVAVHGDKMSGLVVYTNDENGKQNI